MRIWKLTIQDPDHGRMVEWFSSKGQAAARHAEIRREKVEERFVSRVELEQVPGNKAALIDWLNANFNRENG